MPIDKATALAQIDDVLQRQKQRESSGGSVSAQEIITLVCATIEQLAPPGSAFSEQKERALKTSYLGPPEFRDSEIEHRLLGVLRALRHVYETGRVQTNKESDIPAFLQIEKLLTRFHRFAQQLKKRHDGRHTIWINDEYDVQDLLHALLRIDFDDIRPEEWTPSYAGKCSKMDFLLKRQQIVIEVKKTREKLTDKEIGDELLVDIARYKEHPDCSTLICFVYDPEERLNNPAGLKHDLELASSERLAVVVCICQH